MRKTLGNNDCEVAVIGAGPYGLAIAAHLRDANVETRVFGEAMSFWRRHMPRGMKLRSPWNATHIGNPRATLSIDEYDDGDTISRSDPLPLERFVSYGEWFQRNAVPDLDTRRVTSIDQADGGFDLRLADGEVIRAQRVVVALGLANQEYRPPEFSGLPAELVSHTCDHADLEILRGKRVAVIGRGQSACESAALLSEAGAEVELICRGDVRWLGAGGERSTGLKQHVRDFLTPPSAVGPFPLNWLAEVPGVVHRFSDETRATFNARALRAGAAGWLRPRFSQVKINAGRTTVAASAKAGEVTVDLDDGSAVYDHVLLATGYRVDIAKLGVLSPELLARLNCPGGSPQLTAGLESNVPGLHFAGASAVASFGPLMRFIAGSAYAGRAVTQAARKGRGRSVWLDKRWASRPATSQIPDGQGIVAASQRLPVR